MYTSSYFPVNQITQNSIQNINQYGELQIEVRFYGNILQTYCVPTSIALGRDNDQNNFQYRDPTGRAIAFWFPNSTTINVSVTNGNNLALVIHGR